MTQTQHRRQNPAQTRTGLQVTHIRLRAAHIQRVAGGTRRAKHSMESRRLHRVAQLRTRAVGLHKTHIRTAHAGVTKNRLQKLLLSGAVGSRQAGAATVLKNRRPADDAVHCSARGVTVSRSTENHRHAALAATIAVRALVEGMALAVRRSHARHRTHNGAAQGQHVHTHHQCGLALAQLKAAASRVQSHQGRRAGSVQRHARTLQTQHVRNAPRSHRQSAAGRVVHR